MAKIHTSQTIYASYGKIKLFINQNKSNSSQIKKLKCIDSLSVIFFLLHIKQNSKIPFPNHWKKIKAVTDKYIKIRKEELCTKSQSHK